MATKAWGIGRAYRFTDHYGEERVREARQRSDGVTFYICTRPGETEYSEKLFTMFAGEETSVAPCSEQEFAEDFNRHLRTDSGVELELQGVV